MAERRMFAKTIIDSDAFLTMPLSAQALYFHLSMRGDDEGFVNKPRSILRTVGANEDDLRLLIAKNFIIPFDSGIVVIKHWKIHNYIRGDRITDTVYQDEKALLDIKENGSYTICQSNVSQVPDKCQHRLGKDRLGKDSIGKSICADFDVFWSSYPKKVGKETAKKSWGKLKPSSELLNEIISAIDKWKMSDQWQKDNGQFIPNPATWLNQKRWEDELPKIKSGNPFLDMLKEERK